MKNNWVILTGNANRPLANKISERLGKPLATADIRRFSDGEVFVEIQENVRGKDVYVIQSTCPPVNANLMELLIMLDALKRASANEITAIIPYYGYARQDRKVAPRTPISAKLVADLLATAGATRVMSMDLHAGQIQGFFNIPFDNIYAMPVFLNYFTTELVKDPKDWVIVSPDAGGVERARAYAKRLGVSVAMIDKRREKANVAQAMHVVGSVEGKNALLLDDMIDTAGTLTEAARAILENGGVKVFASATHGVFSGPAIERLEKSPIEKIFISDTVPLTDEGRKCGKIEQITASQLIAEAMLRINNNDSLSSLFV